MYLFSKQFLKGDNTKFYDITYIHMNKTKTKKVLAALAVWAISCAQLSNVYSAQQIGTWSVDGDNSFDTAIMWDESFPGTASGTVSGIEVNARVLPALNMTLSAKEINLGDLAPGIASNGSIDIEIGTNAANGVTVRAKSGSGGLTNTSDNSLQINELTTDGSAESYTFASSAGTSDSTVTGFDNTLGNLTASEIANSNETIVYQTNKPELTDTTADVTFTVEATANAQTPAGVYQDNIDFIVTGNF